MRAPILGERVRLLEPLAATGRLALTAYALQLIILRGLTDAFLQGGRDDHWWVLVLTLALIVTSCTLWDRWLGQGPLERQLRVHLPLFRRTRPAAASPRR